MGQPGWVRFSRITDDSPRARRTSIFKEFFQEGLLFVLDAALESGPLTA